MGKLKNWWNNNFESGSNMLDQSDYEIPVKKEAQEEEQERKNNNEAAKLFIDAYDRTIKFPEKSYIFDKLDEIFMDQKHFTNQINSQYKGQEFSCYHFDKGEFDIYYDINCAIEELVEAIRELNTKKWKQTRKQVNRDKILEELVDCTKF